MTCSPLASFSLAAAVVSAAPSLADTPLIVAHRGASHDAPENTLAAFELAWEQDADAIECDVYLTADHRIVCIHDDTTGRVTGQKKGTGLRVADTPFADLAQLDVGSWKHPRFSDQRIPLLQDVIATVPDTGRIFIEIKAGPELVPHLTQLLNTSPLLPEQVSIISFNPDVIAACKQALPAITANWLTSFKLNQQTLQYEPDAQAVLDQLNHCNADGLGCKAVDSLVNEAFTQSITEAGYPLHVWTVDDPAHAERFAQLGAQSITTNRPAVIRDALAPR